MRKIGFLVGILVVLGLFLGVQEQALAQVISGSAELPTIKGETPAFTAKGFEFFITGFVSLDMAYDTNDLGGYENNVTSVPIRGLPLGNPLGPKDAIAKTSDTYHATAGASPIGFGIKGPGLWGGTGRAYFEWDILGTETGVTASPASQNTGIRVKLGYAQLGWPHAITGIGDVTLTFGKAVQPSIVLAPEVPEDPAPQGWLFSWAPELAIGTSLPLGPGNALSLSLAAVDPPNGVFGGAGNVGVTSLGRGVTGPANYSGFPILDGVISFTSNALGRVNYYGGLVPFTLSIGAAYGREEYKLDQLGTGLGPVGKPMWYINGGLILPIIGTKTDKRAGTLGLKVNAWYGQNMDAYLGNIYHGAFFQDLNGDGVPSAGERVFTSKGGGGFANLQYFPVETVMLWGLFVWAVEDGLPAGAVALDGGANYTQHARSLYFGVTKNLNAALSTTLMGRYLFRELDDNAPGTAGLPKPLRGESWRVLWDWSYAF